MTVESDDNQRKSYDTDQHASTRLEENASVESNQAYATPRSVASPRALRPEGRPTPTGAANTEGMPHSWESRKLD